MRSNKLEEIKAEFPRLAGRLNQLAAAIAARGDDDSPEIVPKLVAVSLGLSEAEALGLLMLLERAGLISHAYNIICKATDVLIQTVASKNEIEQLGWCDSCDAEHESSDVRVELVFHPVFLRKGDFACIAA